MVDGKGGRQGVGRQYQEVIMLKESFTCVKESVYSLFAFQLVIRISSSSSICKKEVNASVYMSVF